MAGHHSLTPHCLLLTLLLVLVTPTLQKLKTGENPMYTTDPCSATLLQGKPVSFLDTNAQYTAGACQQLSPGVVLAWTLEEEEIHLEIHAPTEGWVAVGINSGASMLGADVAVGWVNDNGKGHLYDSLNDAKVKKAPIVDEIQNTKLIKSREKGSVTSLLFSRPLVSPDETDKDFKGRVWIVWAFGSEDPEDDMMEYLPFHVREGATSIRFHDEPSEENEVHHHAIWGGRREPSPPPPPVSSSIRLAPEEGLWWITSCVGLVTSCQVVAEIHCKSATPVHFFH